MTHLLQAKVCVQEGRPRRDEATGPFLPLQHLAVGVFAEPKNIAAVDRVANELLVRETLDSDDIGICVDIADGESTEADYAPFKALRTGALKDSPKDSPPS